MTAPSGPRALNPRLQLPAPPPRTHKEKLPMSTVSCAFSSCKALLATSVVLMLASPARAQTLTASVHMDGSQETPPVVTGATADATVTLDTSTGTVSVSGSYTGFGSNQTLAHVHQGVFGVAGGIQVTLT